MSIELVKELGQNFIDFSYEANSQRAFPDARDGLKPGQRACLWEMYEKGYLHNKPHVKSAKISGGVIASWWPHGNVAIYDTFTRMSQDWINNIPEVEWHGSNGSQIFSPNAASERYTEARLGAAAQEGMFVGLNKNNVPMIMNFTEDAEWPEVLPAIMPRLLLNGSMGIGVTIANTWLPMNLKEVREVIEHYVKGEEIDYNQLKLIDFPSGGIITNSKELFKIHTTGKGKVVLRGETEIKGEKIIISSFPYQVYVEPWIDSVKKLIADGTINGINNIYNKSSENTILVEIECSGSPGVILNQLFRLTDLQSSYSANQVALIGNKTPTLLTLKDYLDVYVKHNLECIKKEHEFDLNKAQNRIEIVEGLLKAIIKIDEIITLIKQSDNSTKAKDALKEKYGFTENQAKAIVNMKLGSLARLEGIELEKEKKELEETIKYCKNIIEVEENRKVLFLDRLNTFIKKYGSTRRTQLIDLVEEKAEKEIANVEPEDCVVIMTANDIVKRVSTTLFKVQKRGSKGIKTKEDIILNTIHTNTIDNLLVFTDAGLVYRLLVNDIPNGAKGTNIRSLIGINSSEKVSAIYSLQRENENKFLLYVTKKGMVKKTFLSEYSKLSKKTGTIAIKIREEDGVIGAALLNDEDIIITTKQGMSIRFNSSAIGATGRNTIGVKGITLKKDDEVVSIEVVRDKKDNLAIFTAEGLGKRIKLEDLSAQARAGKGSTVYKEAEVIATAMVNDDDNVLISGITNSVCISAKEIPVLGTIAKGNIVLKGTRLQGVTKV